METWSVIFDNLGRKEGTKIQRAEIVLHGSGGYISLCNFCHANPNIWLWTSNPIMHCLGFCVVCHYGQYVVTRTRGTALSEVDKGRSTSIYSCPIDQRLSKSVWMTVRAAVWMGKLTIATWYRKTIHMRRIT
eukprot:g45990.t1